MEKLNHILRQLSKTNKKNLENYVITRIWHKLDDLEIKFITQQYVKRTNGSYALTDMYFPQFNLHVEVDEKHHKSNYNEDSIRERDIISQSGHEIIRIDVDCSIELVNTQVDSLVNRIKNLKSASGHLFIKWEPIKETSSATYIEKGYICLEDKVAFKRIVDAINCFGVKYKGWQKGGIEHPVEENVLIWFPKLYSNELWENSISNDDSVIYEKSAIPSKVKEHMNEIISSSIHERIVFARVKDNFGHIMYRFKGKYKLDLHQSYEENQLVWRRSETIVRTYNTQYDRC